MTIFSTISMKMIRRAFFSVIFAILITYSVSAHPHIFIDTQIVFHCTNGNLRYIEETWTFDDITSRGIILQFDNDKNGSFSKPEINAVYNGYFTNLRNYHYFHDMDSSHGEVRIEHIKNFSASIKNNQVVYNFHTYCSFPKNSMPNHMEIKIWDPTYYSRIEFRDSNSVHVSGNGAKASLEVASNANYNLQNNLQINTPPPENIRKAVLNLE